MKHVILLVGLVFLSRIGYTCSCIPAVNDFYYNVSNYTQNGIIRLDSTYNVDIDSFYPGESYIYYAVFTLIKGFNFSDKSDGDTLLLFSDGFGCMIGFGSFDIGDTLIAALDTQGSLYYIPFYSRVGNCGTHFLKITNGMNAGLSLAEIEQKVRTIMTDISEPNFYRDLQVIPNPFINNITITEPSNFYFELFNSLGQMVLRANSSSEIRTIDVSNLPRGLYVATVLIEDKRKKSMKLIKE